MSSLKEKANNILTDKSTNLLPENIKKDTTILGVVGTLETLDTSDANVTPDDIVTGKTAYVNGEKITGTMKRAGNAKFPIKSAAEIVVMDGLKLIQFGGSYSSETRDYIDDTCLGIIEVSYSHLAEGIGLTPEKIKAGETILGVTGTYTGE